MALKSNSENKIIKTIYLDIKTDQPEYDYHTIEVPELNKYSVLIDVQACSLSKCHRNTKNLIYLLKCASRERLGLGTSLAGIVVKIGSEVSTIKVGDHVAGIIPLDYEQSGCCKQIVLQEFDLAIKPKDISFVDAAGCIGDATKAYRALCDNARFRARDTVLVLDGASSFGSFCIQLVNHWGGKVIATASSEDEKHFLESKDLQLSHIIELNDRKISTFKDAIIYETGGLGIDIVIDPRTELDCTQSSFDRMYPSKHEIISSLAIGGRWVTCIPDLQLDPPNSLMLNLRSASLCFFFDQAWILSNIEQGRHQIILKDIMKKLQSNIIRTNIHHTIVFDEVVEALKNLDDIRVGQVVMTHES